MPKNTQQRRSTRSSTAVDLSDDDETPASSQRTSKRKGDGDSDKNVASEDIAGDIQAHKVDDVIRYCLASHQNQKPVLRTDIVKNCLGKEYGNLFNDVFAETKTKLRTIFGIEVKESNDKRGYYYLANALPHTDFINTTKTQSVTDALLYAILSNMFMRDPKGKIIDEQAFLGFLAKMGVQLVDDHAVFGNVRQLINKTFVEQGWLEIRRQPGENGDEAWYGWGWRSLLVLNREDMLNFVAEMLFNDGAKSGYWNDHNQIAMDEDEANEVEETTTSKKRGERNER